MPEIYGIIVNYNYQGFLRDSFPAWKDCAPAFKRLVIVDDQSTDNGQDDVFEDFSNIGVATISTFGEKSTDNSLNQLSAIETGIWALDVPLEDFLWVIDADDFLAPAEEVAKVKAALTADLCAVSAILTDRTRNFGMATPRHGLLWLKRATTSQLIVSGRVLEAYRKQIFSRVPTDTWYDARLVTLPFVSKAIIDAGPVWRVQHSANDSARYAASLLGRAQRISRTVRFKARALLSGSRNA